MGQQRASSNGALEQRQSRGDENDTIYALSTASGRAAIAVIRISGPSCSDVYQALCPSKPRPPPRKAVVRTLYDASSTVSGQDSILDSAALILSFPGPKTVTGEDILELHVHGGTAIVSAVLKAISSVPSPKSKIRYAEPGEFTRRAFFNDRLDLTQVEALGDVLAAVTDQQRKLSLRGTAGKLAATYEEWRALLLYARGELEALIDFSEDQHFDESPSALITSVADQVEVLREKIRRHLENVTRGELLRNGIKVALLGAPNAGKSSLMNAIIGRDAAIVSSEPGTTRDIVEVGIDLGGYLCRFGDMAGLRRSLESACGPEAVGAIEQEGIRRAKQWALESDVVVVVAPVQCDADGSAHLALDPEVLEAARRCAEDGIRMLAVVNKIDLADEVDLNTLVACLQSQMPFVARDAIFSTCCTVSDPNGVQVFKEGLVSTFAYMTAAEEGTSSQDVIGSSERHRSLLSRCLEHLEDFIAGSASSIGDEPDIVLAAESLREAANALAKITGRGEAGDVEEVLGVIFEKFCVGK